MANKTSIEWTDATWNPIRGCTRVSEGCRFCYAESVAARFSNPGQAYHGIADRALAGSKWTGIITIGHNMDAPLAWRQPRKIFVNSMSDLFHESLPIPDIATIFAICVAAHHLRGHTLQILTKRPEYMQFVLSNEEFWDQVNAEAGAHVMNGTDPFNRKRNDARATLQEYSPENPPPGIWLGVSVENQKSANERIPLLLKTAAARRFLSCEPLLENITIDTIYSGTEIIKPLAGVTWYPCPPDWQRPGLTARHSWKLHWVICGGESGPNARPMHPDWARSLRDQCAAAGTPFFFKQWGEWIGVSQMSEEMIDKCYRSHVKASLPEDQAAFDEIHGRACIVPNIVQHHNGKVFNKEQSANACVFEEGKGAMTMFRVGKKRAGALLDGIEHKAFPMPDLLETMGFEMTSEISTSTPGIERKWLPSDYMDESIPPPRPSPNDWIERTDDGAYCLGTWDEHDEGGKGAILKDGDRVKFQWTEYHGLATLTFDGDGGYQVMPPMPPNPPGATMLVRIWCDQDSCSDDIATLVKESTDREGSERLQFFCWSNNDIEFVFLAGEFHEINA